VGSILRAAAAAALLVLVAVAMADAQTVALPKLTLEATEARSPQEVSTAVQILVALTVLSVAPAILLMVTSFTRIVIVLSLLRQAIGIQQLPPNQVVIGLSLFLTIFVMAPVGQEMHRVAVQPYLDKKLSQTDAFTKALDPLRAFMLRQTRQSDLALMVQLGRIPQPRTPADLPTHVLVPAYALSEVKTAFQMGFVLFLPFLVIDMVVASILMSMGMMMLPPVMISLPFKLLLFVLADGWNLVIRALVAGYR
jgi:flagellar biosynthetic protein FliP